MEGLHARLEFGRGVQCGISFSSSSSSLLRVLCEVFCQDFDFRNTKVQITVLGLSRVDFYLYKRGHLRLFRFDSPTFQSTLSPRSFQPVSSSTSESYKEPSSPLF